MERHYFYICTFGCKVNQYESQAIREAWTARGWVEVVNPADASDILVNSCAVTSNAVADLRQELRKLIKESPRARIFLTGCAATKEAGVDDLQVISDNFTILDGRKKHFLIRLPELGKIEDGLSQRQYMPFSIASYSKSRPVIKIQDGCSQKCAFCIVPYVRGSSVSRGVKDILSEMHRLLNAGFSEIMISGINLRQFSRIEDGCHDFWELINIVEREFASEWAGHARLRLSSIEPCQLNQRGIDTLLASKMICRHLHISLQSGSDAVLHRMGRGHYTAQMFVDSIGTLSKFWNPMGLGADIICGYPGETNSEFDQTLALVKELPLTYAHVFPYSERPGTRAADMPNPVPIEERKRRSATIRDTVLSKKLAFWDSLIGTKGVMAVIDNGSGVLEHYVPCKMSIDSSFDLPKNLVNVRVVSRGGNCVFVNPL